MDTRTKETEIAVLLADLVPDTHDDLRSYLDAQSGIRVLDQVTLPDDVIDASRTLAPDVIVIRSGQSVFGPAETGFRIRLHQPDVEVVIVSSRISPGDLMLALEAGVHGYIAADEGKEAVAQAIRAVPTGVVYLSKEVTDTLVATYTSRTSNRLYNDPLKRLSKRESQVLKRLLAGESSTDIARQLELSPKTVDTYRRRVMQKVGVSNLPALVKYAVQHGWISPI